MRNFAGKYVLDIDSLVQLVTEMSFFEAFFDLPKAKSTRIFEKWKKCRSAVKKCKK